MTIPTAAKPTPIQSFQNGVPFVNKDGTLSVEGVLYLERLRNYNLAGNRVIPCSCGGTANAITLTPNDASPLIEGYRDYDMFPFVAASSSTGSVTGRVVPKKGTLASLKVYITNGSAQAGNTDITAGLFYIACYVDSLDSGAGGLVLK